MTRIADCWNEFSRKILDPIGASRVQRIETRRAFYAGASSMLQLLVEVAPDHVSEDQGVAHLERLSKELEAFGEDLAAGRA